MTNTIIILGILIVLVAACGCTLPASSVQPPASLTMNTPTLVRPALTTMPEPQSTNHVSENTINITKGGFDPISITVKSGSTVRWVNADSTDDAALYNPTHRITIVNIKDSQLLSPGQGWSWIFDQPGTYYYSDMLHPAFEGTVIVE